MIRKRMYNVHFNTTCCSILNRSALDTTEASEGIKIFVQVLLTTFSKGNSGPGKHWEEKCEGRPVDIEAFKFQNFTSISAPECEN